MVVIINIVSNYKGASLYLQNKHFDYNSKSCWYIFRYIKNVHTCRASQSEEIMVNSVNN